MSTRRTTSRSRSLQGYGFDLTWDQLNEAAIAIHRGAHWVATNIDPTRPTDRGLVPGNGAAVAAVRAGGGGRPGGGREAVPSPARRDGRAARRRAPAFVGDRLDTDIARRGQRRTGQHAGADRLARRRRPAAAAAGSRPTHLGYDLGELLQPALDVQLTDATARCGSAVARVVDGTLVLEGQPPSTVDERVAATWAAAHLAWQVRDAGQALDLSAVLPVLAIPAP